MKLSNHDLNLIGAALYLGEGTKERIGNRGEIIRAVELTNKEPRMIRLFLRFLREIINAKEERIKAQLFLYPDHDIKRLKKYWSVVTNIPLTRFNKTIMLKQRSNKYKPNPLGTMKIRYTHKEDFLRIKDIIDQVFGENPSLGEVA